jgi:hypothetical protein
MVAFVHTRQESTLWLKSLWRYEVLSRCPLLLATQQRHKTIEMARKHWYLWVPEYVRRLLFFLRTENKASFVTNTNQHSDADFPYWFGLHFYESGSPYPVFHLYFAPMGNEKKLTLGSGTAFDALIRKLRHSLHQLSIDELVRESVGNCVLSGGSMSIALDVPIPLRRDTEHAVSYAMVCECETCHLRGTQVGHEPFLAPNRLAFHLV